MEKELLKKLGTADNRINGCEACPFYQHLTKKRTSEDIRKCCSYILITGKMRGCPPAECNLKHRETEFQNYR